MAMIYGYWNYDEGRRVSLYGDTGDHHYYPGRISYPAYGVTKRTCDINEDLT